MATVKLKSKRSGAWVDYPLAYFDFAAWIAAGGTYNTGSIVTSNTGLTPEQLGGETSFYYVRISNAYHYLTDAIKPSDTRNLLYVEPLTKWKDIFNPVLTSTPFTYSTPPAGYNSLGDYWLDVQNQVIGNTHQVSAAPSAFDITKQYYSSDKATAAFDTYNGGSFGISMVVKQTWLNYPRNSAEAHITVGAKQWEMSSTDTSTERNNVAWSPSMTGGVILDIDAGDYRSTDASYALDSLADYEDAICPTDKISTQCVYTILNGQHLCGVASILWGVDSFGSPRPETLRINFLPLWFWGQIQGQFVPDVPDIDDIPVSAPDTQLGSYMIGEAPAGVAVPPAISPIASVDTSHGGLHIFVCDAAAIADIESSLWRQAWQNTDKGIASALSGIIACGFMPRELIGVNYKNPTYKRTQLELGGYPVQLVNGSAWLINHRIWTTTYAAPDSHFCTFGSGDGEPLSEVYHSYMDYEPYTKVKLVVPFCGEISIPASACIGGRIAVDFAANLTTGDICATITATSSPKARSGLLTQGALTTTYYLYGNAFSRFPLTGSSSGLSQYITGAAQVVTGIAAIAAGGVAGVVAGGAQIVGGLAAARSSDAQPVQGGSCIGSPALIGNKRIIIEVTRPTPYADGYYKAMMPPAAEVIAEIGTLKLPATDSATVGGLTPVQVKEVYFENTDDITAAELDQIEALLKGGVLL